MTQSMLYAPNGSVAVPASGIRAAPSRSTCVRAAHRHAHVALLEWHRWNVAWLEWHGWTGLDQARIR